MKGKIDKFLGELNRSKRTIDTYRWALNYFAETVGDAELDMETYENFLSHLKHANHSPSTNRVILAAVDRLYRFFKASVLLEMDQLKDTYIEKNKTQPIILKQDEIEKVITYCEGLHRDLAELRDRAAVLTLVDTGLRISELANMKRGDIDRRNERAVITGKRNKTAVVRFSKRSLAAIDDYLKARAKMDGGSGKFLDTLPLLAQHGRINKTKQIKANGLWKAIMRRAEEVGIPPKTIRVHDFRHYFVTMILVVTGDMKLAKDLARHESVTTTQRYAHYADTKLDKSYDEIFNKKGSEK